MAALIRLERSLAKLLQEGKYYESNSLQEEISQEELGDRREESGERRQETGDGREESCVAAFHLFF